MLRPFIILAAAVFYFSSFAWARGSNVQDEIDAVFDNIAEANYTRSSLIQAQSDLYKLDQPSAVTAAAILAHFELESPTLTKGLLTQLGVRAKTLDLSNGDKDPTDVDSFVALYDGSTPSLASAIFRLNGRERLGQIGWSENRTSPSFTVPCAYFRRRPDIGQFTNFVGRHWHRTSRPSLDIDCHKKKDFGREYSGLFRFWSLGRAVAADDTSCGTLYRDHAAAKFFSLYDIFYRPQDYNARIRNYGETPPRIDDLSTTAFHDWALVGRQNYKTYQVLDKLFREAKADLTRFYETYHGDLGDEMDIKIPYAALSQIHGASRRPSFSRDRDASLQGEREIRKDLLTGQIISDETFLTYKNSETKSGFSLAGVPEPLIHLAINNPLMLRKMIALGFDVEAMDALGKTPLMVAAQEDNLEAVEMLLQAGANVKATSKAPDDIVGNVPEEAYCMGSWAYNVKTGERTALNYALSEASDSVVQVLKSIWTG